MHIAIEAKNVSKMLNQNLIINDLSFKIPKNSITLVKGINGVGKSLTLKLISKLQLPSNGNIYTDSKISYAPDTFPKNIKVTVKQFLLFIINSNDQINKKQVHTILQNYLDLFYLTEFQDLKLHRLSKGTLQKVNIIQCLLADADILIFDEPFSGLDNKSEKRFINHLKQLVKTKTIILTAHDYNFENTVVTHILNLDDYTFKSISKQDTQKLIIVQNHKQNHNNLIMANNEDSIVSTIKISDNKLAIQVYKSKSNLVIQNLIDYNYEIIEVKDL